MTHAPALRAVAVAGLVTLAALSVRATSASAQTAPPSSDSSAAAAAVERYHRALAEGDSATALALLTEDATVLESGDAESREQYRRHHLPADIAYARAVKSARSPTRVTVRGDVAWAISTSTSTGRFRGRAVNSAGAELMVLTREADGWKISVIHWSSHKRGS